MEGRPRLRWDGSYFPFERSPKELFCASDRRRSNPTSREGMSLLRRFRHRLAVFARVGSSVVHAGGKVAQDDLPSADHA